MISNFRNHYNTDDNFHLYTKVNLETDINELNRLFQVNFYKFSENDDSFLLISIQSPCSLNL